MHNRILVLGGNGMVGNAVKGRFRERNPGAQLSAPTRADLDLTNANEIHEYFRRYSFDLVIHCAGKVGGIQANVSNPTSFLYENCALALNVIHAAATAGVKNFIYLGSSCMYPRDYKTPLLEEYLLAAPLEPTNEGYALAKIVGGKLCEYYHRQFGVNYKTIIPCNLFGANDKFDPSHSHLVPSVIKKLHEAARDKVSQVQIWGDGSARREFLYVADLADFMVTISDRLHEVPSYLNVGFGSDFSVLDYHKMIADVVGYAGGFTFDLGKPTGMLRKLLDSEQAHRLGWKPPTPMRDALQRTYEYYLTIAHQFA